ncbi:MAG: DMT family transporter [Candidatus Marinimicrobia bacterium]|nr:DMT family transporter [Candidatus Neomarinimicrobiota bacterium]MBT3635204.1 DMT family transporter [Candidatus Neomarinimicrobiota bacterium]MBT3683950.1 DMT family transporter [Candidatus Neomarinimicrobiota bacterium]MBT3760895.1 DMT family transporter [Candidatus Neomarinimicrobiota bacterium]MBT3896943.1 DMT family transporter [Candidatus Neomarinimicrobiota bacterium]
MKNTTKINFILIVALLCVSTSSIIARWLFDVPAVSLAFWRMLTASIFLWIYSLSIPRSQLSNKNRWLTALSGFFLGLHFLFFFGALKLTTIANATFLATMAPIFTLIIEKLVLKRQLSSGLVNGILIAIVGLIIIVWNDFDFESVHMRGNLLSLTCSFWICITYLLTNKIRQTTTTIVYSRSLYFWAAVTLFIVAIFSGAEMYSFSGMEYTGLVLLGLIPTIFGHSLLYYALKFVPPTAVASVPLGEPVIASIAAMFIFHEFAGLNIFIGGFIILTGLFITIKFKISN